MLAVVAANPNVFGFTAVAQAKANIRPEAQEAIRCGTGSPVRRFPVVRCEVSL
jgi:hypothetical protein